jgi:RNA polymerase sigma factor (sigma-70 family)
MEPLAPVRSKRQYVVAMLLGTALTALTPAPSTAQVPESTVRAINDISRYCTACWRNARLPADCWTDCTQEVFSRLMERLSPGTWGDVLKVDCAERRELLRAIDAVKKRSQRARKRLTGLVDDAADPQTLKERRLADEREIVSRAATELLSPRQQRILQMSFEGWSVQDIARDLNAPAERISDEKYKAIRKLREHLQRDE